MTSSLSVHTQIPIVSTEACREVYGNDTITDDMLCAAPSDGSADACAGDSGAPLLCRHSHQWFQVSRAGMELQKTLNDFWLHN